MLRRALCASVVIITMTLVSACSNSPTSTLNRQGSGTPATTEPATTSSPLATASPSPAASASPAPTATPNANATATPTPGPISLMPASIAAPNIAPAPGSDYQPAVCGPTSTVNYTCFSGTPTEVDPSEASYGGAFTATTTNGSIAATMACSASGAPPCTASNGFLVYPQGVGSTTVAVTDTNGNTTSLPVSVADSTINISLQNVSSPQQVCLAFTTVGGETGDVVSYGAVSNASSNPTVVFTNVPIPVGVELASLTAVINPPNSGMNGCKNGTSQSTITNVTLNAGSSNSQSITVTPTSQFRTRKH